MFKLRRRFFLLLILLPLVAGVFLPAQAQGEAEFWQLAQETHDFLLEIEPQTELDAPQEARLEALAVRWELFQQARLENGAMLPVDGSYWARLLRNREIQGFEGLLNARDVFGAGQMPPNDALDVLQSILARPEFQWREEPTWLQSLWEQFLDWLAQWLGESQGVEISNEQTDLTLDVMNVLAFVLVAGILAYAIRTMFSDFISESALDASAPHETPLNARQALKQADSFSQSGDYRTAVRYLYLSALLILDERGLLYYDRAQTNREYLRQVAGNAQVAGLLREVIQVFDQVWYGFQPLDEQSYQRYAARVRELENQP